MRNIYKIAVVAGLLALSAGAWVVAKPYRAPIEAPDDHRAADAYFSAAAGGRPDFINELIERHGGPRHAVARMQKLDSVLVVRQTQIVRAKSSKGSILRVRLTVENRSSTDTVSLAQLYQTFGAADYDTKWQRFRIMKVNLDGSIPPLGQRTTQQDFVVPAKVFDPQGIGTLLIRDPRRAGFRPGHAVLKSAGRSETLLYLPIN